VVAPQRTNLAEALRQLDEYGLLLLQDAQLPSITTIVAGGAIRGSWLADSHAHGTYDVLVALEDHADVLFTKLLAGKVTMVHRRLWPAVLATATARAAWQFEAMSSGAKWVLEEVDRLTSVQTDLLSPPLGMLRHRGEIPRAARELERRLLVHATEIHTPSGKHAKVLQSWARWAAELPFKVEQVPEAAGRRQLEEAVARLNAEFAASAKVPWG
jgi:hypothetical protein